MAMLQSLVQYAKLTWSPTMLTSSTGISFQGPCFGSKVGASASIPLETQLLVTLKCRRGAAIIIMWHVHLSTAVRILALATVGRLDGGKSYHPEN